MKEIAGWCLAAGDSHSVHHLFGISSYSQHSHESPTNLGSFRGPETLPARQLRQLGRFLDIPGWVIEADSTARYKNIQKPTEPKVKEIYTS